MVASRQSQSRTITILGLGSLLSERSARTTFPLLTNFRLARVQGYRRVFAHTPAIFAQRGITDGLEAASLSAEPDADASYVCTAFEVEDDGRGMDAFIEREEEFELRMVPYYNVDDSTTPAGEGMICLCSSDAAYVERWGQDRFDELYVANGLTKIWGWPLDSGLLPCACYLRHCALAAERLGPLAHASFLDETYLCDRTTTVRAYLDAHPEVLTTLPPEELRERYGG